MGCYSLPATHEQSLAKITDDRSPRSMDQITVLQPLQTDRQKKRSVVDFKEARAARERALQLFFATYSRADVVTAPPQWRRTCLFESASDYECKSANLEDRPGCRQGRV